MNHQGERDLLQRIQRTKEILGGLSVQQFLNPFNPLNPL
jgi:hypothetical protein